MTVINAPDVYYEPTCEVYCWKIICLVNKEGFATQHIVGTMQDGFGRVSTAIIKETSDGWFTESGRRYRLIGPEANVLPHEARRVLKAFKEVNNLVDCCPEEFNG